MTDAAPHSSALTRRNLFRAGGAVSLAALVAACGGESSDAPGRVGYSPPVTDLPTGEVNDAVLLRTGASFQHTVIETIGRIRDEELVDTSYDDVLQRFVDDHTAHAEHLNELAGEAGREPFECANPWLEPRAVEPIFAAILGDEEAGIEPSDDAQRDALNVITSFENMLAASFQALAATLSTPDLRREAALIAATEARHGALLAYKVTGAPEAYVDPALTATTPVEEATGPPTLYSITSRFGALTGITFRLGAADDAGAIPSVTLDTPAANAYVYDFVTC